MKKLLATYCHSRVLLWLQSADDYISYAYLGDTFNRAEGCLKRAKFWKKLRDWLYPSNEWKLSSFYGITENDIC